MDLVSGFLLVVAALKIVSVLQDTRWLGQHGQAYAAYLRKQRPDSEQAYYVAFEQSGGRHFPFGVKDHRLRRAIQTLWRGGAGKRVLSGVLFLFKDLYRFQRLATFGGLYMVIVVSLPSAAVPSIVISSELQGLLLYILAVALLATNVLLSVQAVFAYAILGDYATSFHMRSRNIETWAGGSPLLMELRVLVEKVAATLWSAAVASYVAHVAFSALKGDALVKLEQNNVLSWIALLWQSFYFATTTFATVGYGDIAPANIYGQVVAFLLALQAFAIISIVIVSLFATKARWTDTGVG